MPATLPRKLHLPTGRVVDLERTGDPPGHVPTLRGSVHALAGQVVRLRNEAGELVDPESLALEDFHVLRSILTHAGLLAEQSVEVPCDNCNEVRALRPCELVEPGPFIDGELGDPELDERFPFDKEHEIGEAQLGKLKVKLRPVTVAEARPLHEAIDGGRLRVTSALVRAMGIESLDGETLAPRIARRLQRIDDSSWDSLTDLLDAAYYGPRLRPWWRCQECGARNELEAPSLREFPALALPRDDQPIAGFPDVDAFESAVRKHADALFAQLGVRNVALTVELGVAECDDGGVPLLGSYDPGEQEGSGMPSASPEVRLYYRTFRSMYADEPYDVEREIAETIEHELRHHLAFLSGWDPEDEREHEEISREQGRRVGQSESLRRATRAAGSDVSEFLRRTWPLWLLVAAVTIAVILASR
ncbi:MAG: metallopeptidase family protein [Deltaproteobacteria bacterium]|nr:metallopeptidase family protein [Deltaproteobacteria bacterium]